MKKVILSFILMASLATSAFAVDPFGTGVVGRWKLSENAGNTAGWLDLSANGNDLTGAGTPTSGSGFTAVAGDAIQLTAASSQKLSITAASATGLHDFASAFTISAWINPDSLFSSASGVILGAWTDSALRSYRLKVNASSNVVLLSVSSGGTDITSILATTPIVVGTWLHIFAIWTGTQLELYLDNVSATTPVAFTAGIANFTEDWCIGSQDSCTAHFFNGRIDDVTVWDRALTANERLYVFQLRGDFSTGSAGVNSVVGGTFDSAISLNSATVTGTGATSLLKGAKCSHSWSTVLTGTPTGVTVALEGSVDGGTTFFSLDSSTATIDNMRHVVNKCVDAVRSNLTVLSGGTSPTVTTIIESAQ